MQDAFWSTDEVGGPEWGRFQVLEDLAVSRLNTASSGQYSPYVTKICFFFYLSGSIWASKRRPKIKVGGMIQRKAYVSVDVNDSIVNPYAEDDDLIRSVADLFEKVLNVVDDHYRNAFWKFDHVRYRADCSRAMEQYRRTSPPIELPPKHYAYLDAIAQVEAISKEIERKRPR